MQTEVTNRARRRAAGRYASAGRGAKRRQAIGALNEALRTAIYSSNREEVSTDEH